MSRLDRVIRIARSNLNGGELMEDSTYTVFRGVHPDSSSVDLMMRIGRYGNSNMNSRYKLALLITEGCVCLG